MGEIYANVLSDRPHRAHRPEERPRGGWIDCAGLLSPATRSELATGAVLNGIAL